MPNRDGMGPPWWQAKFRGCGYRITIAREVILNTLAKTEDHLSAEDIYNHIHTKHPNIGLTTIYRTLDVLTNLGLVYRFDFGDKRARYELAEGPKGAHHHHHLVCTGCNRVVDYTDFIDAEVRLLQEIEQVLSKKYGFKITNHLIQFYGLCSRCQADG
ncbi:MAG TPA: transcriptional repressor [Candidatus Omnitrophota bacterium]|nr:transcriptional repressor [Candidatus Omnitrophota bacterium]HPN56342.1 transcriptional repressor [Candidatus Omnitrophota bacterium]